MLAKGAPPHPPPKAHRQSLQVINNSLHFHSSLVCFNPRSSKRLSVFLVRASHPHTTITAAATSSTIGDYSQLDDDPLIPATNDSYTKTQAIEGIVSVGNSGPPTPRTRGLAGNFDKLKAQKLKALAKRASLIKKSVRNCVDEPTKEAKTSISDLQFGTPEKKVVHTPVKHKKEISYVSENDDFRGSGSDASAPRRSAAHSRGWGDGGSVYRFRPNPKSTDHFEGRNKFSAESDFFSRKSFRDVGCSEFMIESLKGQLFLQPSHIQAMAFAPVLDGKTCVIADQSGSGKTLAYLIPIIQCLRLEELQGLGETIPRSPRVLIMVPTAELATQVLNMCRSLSKYGIPFRSMVVTGGHRQKTQLENLEQGVDVLIATPGRFMFLIREGFLELTNLRCAVLDEVDILCNDEDFEVALQNLINSSPVNMQYLFVTATLPVDVYNKLIEIFPDCKMIMGPGIHRTSTGLEEVLVDCSGEYGTEKSSDTAFLNKKSALLQLVEQRPVRKTIIFCNKIETCRKVENVLKRFDRKGSRVRVFPFHAALEQESRLANMKEFMNPQSEKGSLFLVCTDRASRGIDFAGVDHVVLFDFPRDPSEYVRRVGRTARGAGGKGKAFIFVVGKQVSLARRIIERNQKGHPLHEVPSAYELMT